MNESELTMSGRPTLHAHGPDRAEAVRAASARMRAARHERDRHFPHELSTGPAWDLLLELHGEPEAAIAGKLSAATRQRWLDVLAQHGLVTLAPAPALSKDGRAIFDAYLAACIAQGLV